MSLTSGTIVGPYEVVGSLGAGGMGEVYRARDPRLGREVALKVLPDGLAADPRRRARFLREAQVLASLNHPNISTLHGVEESNGQQVLVLELVEGETLGDALRRLQSGMPVRESLIIARQIADALDSAHERGIVHRDLKPDNIVLRPDGTVKVLDFGIAKVLDAAVEGDLRTSTLTDLTGPRDAGVPGTPAYMSPEQLRGEPVEPAVDVWAFGCVLYEMLTGRSAFGRESRRDTLAQILEGDPDFTRLPATTPPLVGRLVRRCLERDRRARLRHIADARAYLEDAVTTTASSIHPPVLTTRRRVAGWIAVAALAGALAAALTMRYALGDGSPRVTRTLILTEAPAVLSVTPDKSLTLTHDGSRLVYVGNSATQIFVRPLDTLTPSTLVTATPGFELRGLAVSPDDAWVSYVENSFTVRKVPLTGGTPFTLVSLGAPFRGGTWDHDNGLIFATNSIEKGLQRVSADGGPVTVLTRPNREQGEATHIWPETLPDGRGVLFTIMPTSGDLDFDAARIAVLDLASGATKTLVRGGRCARYLPSGHLVFVAGSELRAVAFDLRRLEISGTPVAVLPQVATDGIGGANFSLSADGTLAYLEPQSTSRELVWVDRQGKEAALPEVSQPLRHPRISPVNDTRLALSTFRDLFVWDLADAPVQLSFIPFANWLPLWMPDGKRIVFGSWRAGTGVSNIYIQAADGIGAVERLSESQHMQLPYSVTPDGTAVLFSVFGPPTGPDIRLLRLTSRERPASAPGQPALPRDEPVLDTMRHERNGVISPDMRWLAYESDMPGAPGQMNIYVRRYPVDPNGGVWQVSSTGGTHPLWSRTGDELFYLAGDGAMMAARVSTRGDRWLPSAPARLFKGAYVIRTSEQGRQYDVTSDSGRFLMIKEDSPVGHRPVVIVQHWAEELKQRVR